MKKCYLYFGMLFLILTACERMSTEEVIVDRIIYETYQEVRLKYGFSYCGFSEGGDPVNRNLYKKIGIMLGSQHKIEKHEGRRILFEISKIMIDKINSNEKLQPFLANHPFTENNLGITLLISLPNEFKLKDDYVAYFSLERGEIDYAYHVLNDKFKVRFETEKIEDARQLLQDQ